jgi:transcriptional regulator with XRE-family HTH domain
MTGTRGHHDQQALQDLLRELRQAAGLRQVDVAKALGVPQSTVSKYESGERRVDVQELRALCAAFGITLQNFVDRLDERIRAV